MSNENQFSVSLADRPPVTLTYGPLPESDETTGQLLLNELEKFRPELVASWRTEYDDALDAETESEVLEDVAGIIDDLLPDFIRFGLGAQSDGYGYWRAQ